MMYCFLSCEFRRFILSKFILFCLLISSCFLVPEESQQDILELRCVDTVEKNTSIAEQLRKDPLSVDLLEIFGAYGKNLTDDEFHKAVISLIERNPDLAHCALDKHGNRIIHVAVCRSIFELVQELLEKYKVQVNQENGWSMSPLEIADICEHQTMHKEGEFVLDELNKELLDLVGKVEEADALDEDTASLEGLGAITCVSSFEKEEFMGELLKSGSSTVTILELLGAFGYTITNQQLEAWIRRELEKNPQIGTCAVDSHGNTLVHITSCRQMVPVTELLLEQHKADVNAINSWGLSPLDMVLVCGAEEQKLVEKVLDSLINQQEQLEMPDLDKQDKQQDTPSDESVGLLVQADQESSPGQVFGDSPYDTLHDEL